MLIENQKIVQKIWAKWLRNSDLSEKSRAQLRYFDLPVLHTREGRKFESWLFEQGVILRRKNKKYCLEFFDEQDCSLFLLKYE